MYHFLQSLLYLNCTCLSYTTYEWNQFELYEIWVIRVLSNYKTWVTRVLSKRCLKYTSCLGCTMFSYYTLSYTSFDLYKFWSNAFELYALEIYALELCEFELCEFELCEFEFKQFEFKEFEIKEFEFKELYVFRVIKKKRLLKYWPIFTKSRFTLWKYLITRYWSVFIVRGHNSSKTIQSCTARQHEKLIHTECLNVAVLTKLY